MDTYFQLNVGRRGIEMKIWARMVINYLSKEYNFDKVEALGKITELMSDEEDNTKAISKKKEKLIVKKRVADSK